MAGNNTSAFDGLPDEILAKIFKQLGFATRRTILPLVCKEWHQFTERSVDLWAEVTVSAAEEESAFQILQRSHQTGGLALNPAAPLRVQSSTTAGWFQRRTSAVVTSLDFGNWAGVPTTGAIMTRGNFGLTLVGLRGNLENLRVSDSLMIRAEPYLVAIGWLLNLKSLELMFRPFGNPPARLTTLDLATLANLEKLESLELCGSMPAIEADPFPDAFFELPSLKRLVLRNISSDGFADRLGRLTGLTSLAIRGVEFGAPVAAQQAATLTGLITLDISYTNLDELPDLSALRTLRTLRCLKTTMSSFPVAVLRGLPQLEEIDFSLCSEMAIPESVVELSGLRRLRMLSVQGCQPSLDGMRAMMQLVNAVKSQEPNISVLIGPRSSEEMMFKRSKECETLQADRNILSIHV